MNAHGVEQVIGAAAIAGLPLASLEILSRRYRWAPELSRKLVHAGSSLAAAALPLLYPRPLVAGVALGFAAGLAVMRRHRLWHSLYRIERRSWGELWFPLGVAAAALLSPTTAGYILAMLCLGLADTAAAVVGQRFGGRRLPGLPGKTWAGSAACLGVALVLGAGFAAAGIIEWPRALAAAVLVAVAEAAAPRGSDNLAIPFAVIAALQ
ncbi:MAG TPA: hypothetical protein VHQ86_05905 [Candidatus Saccharimonadia bacterium]|jgi:dolichol kinase|nr:hypothetical protein [Candidatus Saccharimonadia bacterium]